MESSFLIEVDNTSTIRTGALHCYHYTLTPLPASRLLFPRSGLERSDFVRWLLAAVGERPLFRRYRAYSGHRPDRRRGIYETEKNAELDDACAGIKPRHRTTSGEADARRQGCS